MTEKGTKKIYNGQIVRNEQTSYNSYFIEIEAESPMSAEAGQFISVYCNGLTFRRPFSVFSNDNGKIGILFKERGKGTQYIKSLKVGDNINITGASGNCFKIENKKSLLVGAGIGVAPVSYLRSKLKQKGTENIFISGYRNEKEIPSVINSDITYTDDGSYGEKGSILVRIEKAIKEYRPEVIYACAPRFVLKSIAETGKKYGIETQIAMEKVMACGIGVCRGCVIEIIKDGKIQNASVCKDGPVFRGDEIVW